MKKILFLFAVAIVSVTWVKAQTPAVVTNNKPGWHKIGETTVGFKADRDVLKVFGADNFRALRLKATDAPVHIESLVVVYENGEPENIPIRYDFKRGSTSRVINLKGRSRRIKHVEFVYRSVPNWRGEKAHIELWGLK